MFVLFRGFMLVMGTQWPRPYDLLPPEEIILRSHCSFYEFADFPSWVVPSGILLPIHYTRTYMYNVWIVKFLMYPYINMCIIYGLHGLQWMDL